MALKTILVMIWDLSVIHISILLAYYLRYLGEIPWRNLEAYISISGGISLIAIGLLWLYELLPYSKVKEKGDIFPATFLTTVLLNLGIMALSYLSREFAFPRSIILIQSIIIFSLLTIWRYSLFYLVKKYSPPLKLCVIGGSSEVLYIKEKIKDTSAIVLEIQVTDHTTEQIINMIENYQSASGEKLDGVIIGREINALVRYKIGEALILRQVRVYVLPLVYEILIAGGNITSFKDIPVIEIKSDQFNGRFGVARRFMDITFSLLLFIIFSPVMLICSLLILLESGRPVIFKQERVTNHGKVFTLYKFRSMIQNAEELTGPTLSCDNDFRVTKVGRIIRMLRFDELPQLYNVLRGDMSLVGPRPERPIFVSEITAKIPCYELRHEIKSGITGMAQIQGNYSTRVEDKLVWDLLYAKKHNPLMDINLILKTVKTMLTIRKAS
ncbi:sugar transferase [Desulforamulus ferrireducens]|uniref:Bacterial sugar transferase domain-containing protein n=1 Tax=Desulforamulus ferrireducens TaxID=1833852 RepID=A0A1S6J022_9FIRM|nr:sugar transferase [Desulforamulus ferrireducens]AQS60360.1 hypothetical protein B0537_15580 [Desulforamulus ferrireducens]